MRRSSPFVAKRCNVLSMAARLAISAKSPGVQTADGSSVARLRIWLRRSAGEVASAMSEECNILRTKARASEICYILRTKEGRESEGAKRLCFQTVDGLANGIPGTFDGALGGFAQQL